MDKSNLIAKGSYTSVFSNNDKYVIIESQDKEKADFYEKIGLPVFNKREEKDKVIFTSLRLYHVKRDVIFEEDIVSYLQSTLELMDINSFQDFKKMKKSYFLSVMIENFGETFDPKNIKVVVNKYFNAFKNSIIAMSEITDKYTINDVDIHYWQFMQLEANDKIYCIDCFNLENEEW